MDTSDKPFLKDENGRYPFGWQLEVSDAPVEWFVNEVCATDLRIIVFSHSPIHNAGIIGTEGSLLIRSYDDLLNGPKLYYLMKRNPKVIANIAGACPL